MKANEAIQAGNTGAVRWLSPAAAARAIGCSRATVWRYMASGELQSMRIGPRVRRVAVPAELVTGEPRAAA